MPELPLAPFWQTEDRQRVKLYLGNVLQVLARMPAGSVQCAVTSPPYWALRDYGTGEWEGGDPKCNHARKVNTNGVTDSPLFNPTGASYQSREALKYAGTCPKCGARRIDQQIGSEPSPDCGTQGQAQCGQCFVCTMVAVFRGVRRVLRDDGTLFLNLGDTYGGIGNTMGDLVGGSSGKGAELRRQYDGTPRVKTGLPSGNLVGIPWRVALALQVDGWVLRSDIPWVKRSSMPESVTNRPAKALEYVFILTKSMDYYYDAESVRVVGIKSTYRSADFIPRSAKDKSDSSGGNLAATTASAANRSTEPAPPGRNFRNADLWFQSVSAPHGLVGAGDELVGLDVTTEGFAGRHFATYPQALIRPLILAGTSRKGACAKCGAPWERVVGRGSGGAIGASWHPHDNDEVKGNFKTKSSSGYVPGATLGWQPTCECHGEFVQETVQVERPVSLERAAVEHGGIKGTAPGQNPHSDARQPAERDRSLPQNRNGITGSLDGVPRETELVEETVWVYKPLIPLDQHPLRPCIVLDPFIGSGTTSVVCLELGLWSWGIDLSEKYLKDIAIPRLGRLQRYPHGESRHFRKLNARLNSLLSPRKRKD